MIRVHNFLMELRKISYVSEEQLRHTYIAYSELVQVYTTRHLTQVTDILNAFARMLSFLDEYFGSTNVSGLPVAALDLALLWTPTGSLTAREVSEPINKPSSTSTTSGKAPEVSQPKFPSWSWAGWIGNVNYQLISLEKEPLPKSLIETGHFLQRDEILSLWGFSRVTRSSSREEIAANLDRHMDSISSPEPSQILYLTVPFVDGRIFTTDRKRAPDYPSNSRHAHSTTSQPVVRLLDKRGRYCGILFEHHDYCMILKVVNEPLKHKLESELRFNNTCFIAISRTEDNYNNCRHLMTVQGYIPLFNDFPTEGPSSAMVNVLHLNYGAGDLYSRVAVGQIHVQAWEEAYPTRRSLSIG